MKEHLSEPQIQERTLDPADWDAFSALAHQIVDTMLEHMRTLRDRPAWTESPAEIRQRILDEPLPMQGQGEAQAFEDFVKDVLPYGNGNGSPRFFGWFMGNGMPLGMMADMLASGMNPHLAGFNQNPVAVEQKVVEWLRELMGFPPTASGILLSGGSIANLTGLIVARNAKAGFDIKRDGLQGGSQPLLTVYGSSETHSWAKKAVESVGMGDRSYRRVATNADYTMDIGALRQAIADDKAAGHRPTVVLATAGTVNNGAFDDLNAIADLCKEENLWLHVDGAFGALAAISPKLRHLVAGLERADSVALDLHKWMYLPFEIACLLVRDGDAHRDSFGNSASYIATLDRGVGAGGYPFAGLGLELTRGFKALKAWMAIKAIGIERFAELIEQNVDQAQYLRGLVLAAKGLELAAPVPLNIVCFRFRPAGIEDSKLDELNRELLYRIQEQGIAVPSSTVLEGKFCIRVCIANHRTQLRDLDALVEAAISIGEEILSSWS